MTQLTHRVTVRMGQAHLDALRRAEQATGLSGPEVVRRAILGVRIAGVVKKRQIADIDQIRADLGRLGGLLVRGIGNRGLPPTEARQTLWELRRLLPFIKRTLTEMLEDS